MTSDVTLIGARYSVYVRAAAMALECKGVSYNLHELDIFSPAANDAAYRKIHPFGRIPAFRHGSFSLYETVAINRYVDEAFDGPPLQPDTPAKRARMTQIISITDSYGYRPLVWDIYVELVSKPREGAATDEARVGAALPKARLYLAALNDLMGDHKFLAGEDVTLADCHVAPVFGYFVQTEESHAMLKEFANLDEWWRRVEHLHAWKVAAGLIEASS